MKKIYLIADTHFSHENIIKYCNRPFNDIDEMNNEMINNWNNIVKKDDIVYHLGDFTIDSDDLKNLVNKLNGEIYFIRGNHDGKSIKFYNNLGLEVIPNKILLKDIYNKDNHYCASVDAIGYKPILIDEIIK